MAQSNSRLLTMSSALEGLRDVAPDDVGFREALRVASAIDEERVHKAFDRLAK